MLTCEELSGRLALVAGDDLEGDRDGATCVEHLRGCASCRDEMAAYRRARTLMTHLTEPDVDVRAFDELHARVLAVVGDRQRSKRRVALLPAVGLAGAVAAAAWAFFAQSAAPARHLTSAVSPKTLISDGVLEQTPQSSERLDTDHETFRAGRRAYAASAAVGREATEVATESPGVRVVWLGEIPRAVAPGGAERL